jgi:hypothetical protein
MYDLMPWPCSQPYHTMDKVEWNIFLHILWPCFKSIEWLNLNLGSFLFLCILQTFFNVIIFMPMTSPTSL